jgi:hypothetical protein
VAARDFHGKLRIHPQDSQQEHVERKGLGLGLEFKPVDKFSMFGHGPNGVK